ncbi:hypothetical protein [Thermoflexus sp.]|uniref:hypothetical protein n=1 Tax=Thermoflexus sp. TaxID=1969742 RepID=UPI0035E40AC9
MSLIRTLGPLSGMFLLLGIFLAGAAWAAPEEGPQQPFANVLVGELVAGRSICQTFVARFPHLAEIRVRIGTYGRHNQGELRFVLREGEWNGRLLRVAYAEMAILRDHEEYAFTFPPVTSSAGRRFTFCLEAPGGQPGNAVAIWAADTDQYPEGEALLRGFGGGEADRVQDLAFRAGYALTIPDRWVILAERLGQGKPVILRWGAAYGLVLGMYLLGTYLAFRRAFTLG